MLPFVFEDEIPFENGEYIFVKDIKKAIEENKSEVEAYVVSNELKKFTLRLNELTKDEREIILHGCLINFYKQTLK